MRKTARTTLLAIAAVTASASAFTFTEFRQAPSLPIPLPAVPDSTSKLNPFAPESLLEGRNWVPSEAESAGWTTLATDTAGRLTLLPGAEKPLLHTLSTRVRADKFAKGKLLLSSSSRAAVKIDGKTLISKNSSDSLPSEESAELTLEPQRTYDITVDILAHPEDKSAPEFSLEFKPDEKFDDVAISATPSTSKRVTPQTIMGGERTYRALISPDGRYLLHITWENINAKETLYRARVLETASGKIVAEDVSSTSDWMPEGSSLYYTVKRGKNYDFYTMEIPSLKKTLLASGIPDKNCSPVPGGQYLIYYKNVDGKKESGPMHRVLSPDDRIPGDRDRTYMMRYDIANHISTPITYGGNTTNPLAYTSDGKMMLYATTRQTPERYPFYYQSLIEMDMESLRTDTIIRDEEGYISAAAYSPDGSKIFIISGPDAFNKVGANYAPHSLGNGFDAQGYIFDRATRKVTPATKDFDPSISREPVWNKNGLIYFLGETGFFQHLYCLDPKTGKITELPAETPYVSRFSIGDNESEWLAYTGGSFTADGKVGLLNLRTGKGRVVADPLAPSIEGVEFGEMHPWTFISDGTEIDGWYCLPPGFDKDKKYPLIVYYYGGTSPCEASFRHLYSPQVLASRGYVVYVLNPSGTTGYGQEFSARHVNAWGKQTADDIITGVKEFCRDHSFVDDKKIGCIGASYGGFMTMYLQTRTDIFAAAVSHAGISNVTSYWGEGYWGYSYNAVAAAESYPWNNPELFTRQGALFNADKIHTPLLLLHGEKDTNVPIGESIQLFNALKILGRDVELITVEDENHIITGYDHLPAWQNTIMAWFAKWLQDDPRWWDALYGE